MNKSNYTQITIITDCQNRRYLLILLFLICTGLFYACGVLFILITTLIAIFKKEKDNRSEVDHLKINIIQNYSLILDILKLPGIKLLTLTLLTAKVKIILQDSVII